MSRRYKVAMVAACPFPCGRGTPVRIQRMAEGLAERGHEVHVATYHLEENIPLNPAVQVHRNRNVSTYNHFKPGPTLQKLLVVDTLLQRTLRSVLQQNAIDVIHAHHVEGLLVALMARRIRPDIPVVFDAHTLLESELPFYVPAFARPITRKLGFVLDRRLSGKANHLIAVTDDLRERLLELGVVSTEQSTTVDNGVEQEPFADFQWTPRADSSKCALIFTGNLAPYQGIEGLLRAFARIRCEGVSVTLRIVTQSSFQEYESLARELGICNRVELITCGFEDVPEWLSRSDIALNPRVEAPGLPQKTMNYMAAGMPIVSFAGSGQHLLHEQNALLVEGGEPEAFAQAIERLIRDPELASRVGHNARQAVLERNWQWTTSRVEAVYDQVCGNRDSLQPAGDQRAVV